MQTERRHYRVDVLTAVAVVVLATALADVSLASYRIGFDKYHNYAEMTDYLTNITHEFSNASSLYSIGKSVLNRELWVVKLTTATDLLGVPNIKIVGNIHGNEPVGREIVLHLVQYLLDNVSENEAIDKLLRTTVIHLLPSMNPDGFELSRPQPCPIDGGGRTVGSRGNAHGFDLNRNFPDTFNPHTIPLQPETRAIVEWLKSVPFVMSLGLHGGALVANYPYDDSEDSLADKLRKLNETLRIVNIVELYKAYDALNLNAKTAESLTSDDDVFRFLAKQYAKLHPTMHMGQSCTDEMKFKDGITNGAVWYQVIGSMQDYNYAWHGCLEITLEMSCCKYPPASFLESHWNENLTPLVTWMQQSHRGVKGVVTSRPTGKPIPNATLSISGRDNAFNTTKDGEYWKILLPGVYRLVVNAAGHDEKTVRVEVPAREDPAEGPQPRLMNVSMEPTTKTTKTRPTTTTTTTTTKTADSSAVDYTGVESEAETTTARRSRFEDRKDDGDEDSRSVRPPMSVSSFSAAGPEHNRCRYRVTETVTPLCLVVHLVTAYCRR